VVVIVMAGHITGGQAGVKEPSHISIMTKRRDHDQA
jgi:hypothetical protein